MKDNYQHILLAVDFTADGNHVARKARHLAEIFKAKLSIIHVLDNIPMPDTAYGSVISLNESSGYDLLEAEKLKLKQLGMQLGVDPDYLWLIWGIPGQEIVRIANQESVDLIIVGSHGRHGLALLLGSTANSVLHHAKCDVIAIRLRDEAESDEPLLEKIELNPVG
jgi:universal stress protein A